MYRLYLIKKMYIHPTYFI